MTGRSNAGVGPLLFLAAFLFSPLALEAQRVAPASTSYPILFVTQVPVPGDFTTVASTFGNHIAPVESAPRGGDLWIRYPDGTLRNLTRTAGFGADGMQGVKSIAVRDPSVHWNGTRALFSMVTGAPPVQYQWNEYRWQIYEITGLEKNATPVITKLAGQPAQYNNVTPFYGTDDQVFFTSDRPRDGSPWLYPQLDEYEEAPTITGLWSLDPATQALRLLNHTPSGVFSPSIDSSGRIIFTRWDHLQRDQQADTDADGGTYGTFDFADESQNATRSTHTVEVFPEPRGARTDLLAGTNLEGNSINHFFPWEMDESGAAEETLNHVGRHELHSYFDKSLKDDTSLTEFISATSGRMNQNSIENVLQMKEDPTRPGVYFGTDAPEFYTHAAGQIISIAAPPGKSAEQMTVDYITARSTSTFFDDAPPADASGHYRDPLPLSDGSLLVVHSSETREDRNDGTRAAPVSRYSFRIKTMKRVGNVWVADQPLTGGIHGSVSYWDPDQLVTWSGDLWELTPVEVRPRVRPAARVTPLPDPEARVFQEEGVDPQTFKRDLAAKGLAVIVARNVTTRDAADKQQPYNLRVPGGVSSKTASASTKTYDVAHMQFFQADQVRGVGGTSDPKAGRRVLARVMHDPAVSNPTTNGPAGSVRIASDGSIAALVPAHRAMSWQMTDTVGTPVVRERYWLSFQPGEVRVCTSCHGVNHLDQAGKPAATNEPEALRTLLRTWKSSQPSGTSPGRRRSARH